MWQFKIQDGHNNPTYLECILKYLFLLNHLAKWSEIWNKSSNDETLYTFHITTQSDNKHGCHRKILFLIGWILITQAKSDTRWVMQSQPTKSLVIIQLPTRCSYFIVWCCCHLYANCYQMILFVLVDQFFPNSTQWSMVQDYGWDLFIYWKKFKYYYWT